MALGIFTRTCAKNVAGATKVFIAESAVITGITVTAEEISAITGTTPFMRVDTEQDTIAWEQNIEQVGANNVKVSNTIDLLLATPKKAMNTFVQALIDGSPCGLFAIVTDGNAQNWLVGYNTTDLKSRPLRLKTGKQKTGKGLSEADGQTHALQLSNESAGIALPFDTTLNGVINAGTSTIIKWV